MKKVEIKIPGDNTEWGTIKTKYPADTEFVGNNELTGESKNFDTNVKGIITKRKDEVLYNVTDFTAPPKDQYEAIFVDGVRHLLVVAGGTLKYSSGGGTFTDVTSGYSSNSNFEFTIYDDKVYFGNGVNNPQVYDRATSYGGVSYAAPKTKDMGCQPPSSAPNIGTHTSGGSVPDGAHTYKVTFLYYDAEESNGGPATTATTVTTPNNTVPLSSIPIGGYGVTARKIYRDDNDGNWLLVGVISDNTTTTFTDTVSTGTTPIPISNDIPPQFKYIVTHLDRNWIAGITGDSSLLMFSEAGLPNIFPAENYILCNPKDPITGLYVFNDRIIVFNRNSMGQIIGTTKDTFRYSEIPSTIGCVDNRSIQIRTIVGVPTLIWLSDKGFYSYNGSSVTYISDPIEDLVNLNIQQSQQIKSQNAQTTEAHFNAGTASPAILTAGGTITVNNPIHIWDDESDWETGTTLSNVATNSTTNQLRVPLRFNPSFASGVHTNTAEVSGTLQTPTSTDFTGQDFHPATSLTVPVPNASNGGFPGMDPHFGLVGNIYQKIVIQRTGVLTEVNFPTARFAFVDRASPSVHAVVREDSAGSPGAILHDYTWYFNGSGAELIFHSDFNIFLSTPQYIATAPMLNLSPGVYWVGYERVQDGQGYAQIGIHWVMGSSAVSEVRVQGRYSPYTTPCTNMTSMRLWYYFTSTPTPTSGIWTSPIYDSLSDGAIASSIEHSGVFPTGTSSITTVEASNSYDMSTGVVSQTFNNLNGLNSVSLPDKRYWRIKIQLYASDDRVTAQIGAPTLKYNTTAVWTSGAIDHTTDIVSLDSLVSNTIIPTGTSVTTEIATSADNISYSSYGPLGSATPQRYSKIRITLTASSDDSITPSVLNTVLTWSIVANLVSSIIDTSNAPAGWDIFQADSATNGGSLTFEMRSASTIGGLSGATWYTVSNGVFPTVPANRYANWRVTLTAHANQVPTVSSVALNWFISTVDSIRVASLFYNRNYYLAAAEYNQTANNLMLVYDSNGMWRIYREISASTLSFFFNDPYYGSSTSGHIYRFLYGNTNPIELILDTKEFDLGYPDKTKILRNIRINGNETGAKYYPQFSVDGGNTWIDLINPYTGLTYYQTSPGGAKFSIKFVPVFKEGVITAGRTIKLRIKESTEAEAEIESIKAEMWIRAGERNG